MSATGAAKSAGVSSLKIQSPFYSDVTIGK